MRRGVNKLLSMCLYARPSLRTVLDSSLPRDDEAEFWRQ